MSRLLLHVSAAPSRPKKPVALAIGRGPASEGAEYQGETEQDDQRNCKEHPGPHQLLCPRSALRLGLGVLRRWSVQELPEYLFGGSGVEGDWIAAPTVPVRRRGVGCFLGGSHVASMPLRKGAQAGSSCSGPLTRGVPLLPGLHYQGRLGDLVWPFLAFWLRDGHLYRLGHLYRVAYDHGDPLAVAKGGRLPIGLETSQGGGDSTRGVIPSMVPQDLGDPGGGHGLRGFAQDALYCGRSREVRPVVTIRDSQALPSMLHGEGERLDDLVQFGLSVVDCLDLRGNLVPVSLGVTERVFEFLENGVFHDGLDSTPTPSDLQPLPKPLRTGSI